MHEKLVTGFYGLAEFYAVYGHEENAKLVFFVIFHTGNNNRSGCLRHSFNLQNARHYRISWKMPLEKFLVHGNVFQTDAFNTRLLDFQSVNQQKG